MGETQFVGHTIPSLKDLLLGDSCSEEDLRVVDGVVARITRLCEAVEYDPVAAIKKTALDGLRHQLPFEPVVHVDDNSLYLSPAENPKVRIYSIRL